MRSGFVLGVAAVLVVAGCSGDKTKTAVKPDSTNHPPVITYDTLGRPIGAAVRAPSVNRVVRVNGSPSIVVFTLLTPPSWFAPPFTTYRTSDTQLGSAQVGSAGSITLTPTFNGKNDPNAYIQIQSDTGSLAAADPAGTAFKALMVGRTLKNLSVTPDKTYPWAEGAATMRYVEDGKSLAGSLIVGHRGRSVFRILTQYPVDLKTEMGPRLQTILNQWRWEDDHTYLVPAPPAPPVDTAATGAKKPAANGAKKPAANGAKKPAANGAKSPAPAKPGAQKPAAKAKTTS